MEINMEKNNERVLGYSMATVIDKDRLAEVSGGGGAGDKGLCRPTMHLTGAFSYDVSPDY